MTGAATRQARPQIREEVFWPLLLSAAGWTALVMLAASGVPLALCASTGRGIAEFTANLGARLLWLSPGRLALEWGLMSAAMMPPLFIPVAQALTLGSFRSQRRRNIALAGLSYATVLAAAGGPVICLVVLARAALDSAGLAAAAPLAGFGVAALWQASPLRLRALRRCHRPYLPSPSRRSALAYGAGQGWSCGLACLPAMGAAMLSGLGLVPMFVVMHLLLLERTAHRPPVRAIRNVLLATGAALSLANL